jgi:hypothetical protein
MSTVAASQVQFHPGSFGDFNGRVFHWEGELYRGISAAPAARYRKLFDDGTIVRLIQRNLLVETAVSPLAVEGFDLVLKHRRVPVVSYAYEWCAGMLKDAALLTIDLEIELAARGLTLQDAHPWNVLFDGPRPCWVDFGSIVPDKGDLLWRAYDEFKNFYLHPLLVMAEGHHRVARRMLADSDDGLQEAEAAALTRSGRARSILDGARQRVRAVGRRIIPMLFGGRASPIIEQRRDVTKQRPHFLQELRDRVADIPIRPARFSTVHTNGSNGRESLEPDRRAAVERALAEVRPQSVFEVAYEAPFHCTLATTARSIAVCVDEGRVERLYQRATAERLNVLPLVMDVRSPSPGYGVCGQTSAPATERLACDLVIALDVLHQLGVKYRLNFDQIARALGTFAKRAVLVDFVDARRHPATKDYWSDDFADYTPANFRAALERAFPRVECLAGTTRPTFLCLKGDGR